MVTFNGFAIDEMVQECWWMHNGRPCNARLKTRDLSAHLRGQHGIISDSTVYQCHWYGCASSPMTKSSLERHVKEQHIPGKWACPMCEETITNKDALRKHLRERCPGMNGGNA
ncbi:hypothetical protein BS17DRAFT_364182 [Gyrodon lividus]|nr:hypothetical protein BS17DRAFT_364182 [Gyrodon lividus]